MKKGTILPVLLSLVLLASCGEKGEISSTVTDSGSASESVSSAVGADEIWRVDDCPTEFAIGVPFHIADYLETDPPGAPLSFQPLTPNVTIDADGNCTLISAGDFAIRVTSGSAVRRFEGKAVSQELLEAKAILSSIKNQYQCAGLMIDMDTGQYGYLDLTVHDEDYYWSLAIGGGLLRSKAGHTYQYEIEAVESGAAGEIGFQNLKVLPGRYSDLSILTYGSDLPDLSNALTDVVDKNGMPTRVAISSLAVDEYLYYGLSGFSLASVEGYFGVSDASYYAEVIKDEEGNTYGVDIVGSSARLQGDFLYLEFTAIGETGLVEPVVNYIESGSEPARLENPTIDGVLAGIASGKTPYTMDSEVSVGTWAAEDTDYSLWEKTEDPYIVSQVQSLLPGELGSYRTYVNGTTHLSKNLGTGEEVLYLPYDGKLSGTSRTSEEAKWSAPTEIGLEGIWEEGIGSEVGPMEPLTPSPLTLADWTKETLSKTDPLNVVEEEGKAVALLGSQGDDEGALQRLLIGLIPFRGVLDAYNITTLAAGSLWWDDLVDPLRIAYDEAAGTIEMSVSLLYLASDAAGTASYGIRWKVVLSDIGVDNVPAGLEDEVRADQAA